MQSRRRRRGSTMSVAQGQSLRGEANSSISAIRGSTIRPAIADRSEGGGMALRTRTAYVDCSRGLFSWIVYVNCLRELFTWMADAQPTPSGHAPAGKIIPFRALTQPLTPIFPATDLVFVKPLARAFFRSLNSGASHFPVQHIVDVIGHSLVFSFGASISGTSTCPAPPS